MWPTRLFYLNVLILLSFPVYANHPAVDPIAHGISVMISLLAAAGVYWGLASTNMLLKIVLSTVIFGFVFYVGFIITYIVSDIF